MTFDMGGPFSGPVGSRSWVLRVEDPGPGCCYGQLGRQHTAHAREAFVARVFASMLMACVVGGCVNPKADGNIYGGLFGQQVTGNAVSVSISNVWNEADALGLADKHCAQFGKAARIHKMTGHNANFDCVAP